MPYEGPVSPYRKWRTSPKYEQWKGAGKPTVGPSAPPPPVLPKKPVTREQIVTQEQIARAIEAGKTVLEKKSGEVIITTPKTGAVKEYLAAVPWKERTVVAPPPRVEPSRPAPPGPPYLRREPSLAPPRPVPTRIMEPPEMPAIRVTAPTPFTLFRAEPKAVIGPERVYEKPSPELFEFLVPKRTEREIAYGPPPTVGFRPIVEFGLGAAYGVVTLPAAIIKTPESIYTLVTRPVETLTAMGERFARMPGFFVGEISGQVAATYGLGKLVGLGVAKIKARGITTELVAGEYTYRDISGKRIGLARAKAVILKKKKPIAKLDIETIFKPAEIGEISPAVSRIMVTKPKPMRLIAAAKGITYPEVAGFYPGVSKVLIFEKGKPVSVAAIAGITKVEAGGLRAAGISVAAPPKARAVFGAIFREAKAPPPMTFIKVAPKVITKPGVPAVAVTTEAITKAVGKVITKPSPIIPRAGVLTGAITAFIGKAEAVKYMPAEEEVYISPRARAVAGVQAIDTRQRVLSMQRFGLGTGQAQATLSQLGITARQDVRPIERMDIILRQPPALIQIPIQAPIQRQPPELRLKPPIQKVVPILKHPPGLKQPPVKMVLTIPTIKPPTFPLIPTRKKKVVKKKRKARVPAYKYREIKHPFPSISKLMGI